MNNIEKTKVIVESYLRGDVPKLLTCLADDVEWEYGSINDVPWYRARRGKEDVADFFQCLADVDFLKWEPRLFLGEGDLTVVVLDSDYRIKSTGRRVIYEDCVLLFWFNEDGKLARFGHRADLLSGWLAYHGKEYPAEVGG